MDKVWEFVEKAYTATPYAPYNRHYNHASKSDTNKSCTDKGIACGINNLMKCEDGERLGGHASAEDDFKGYGTLGGSLDNDFMS